MAGWQPLLLLLLLQLLRDTSESLLCGSVEEVKLPVRGSTSAISLTLSNGDQNAINEPCTLSIYAPNVYALSLRLIDAENPFVEFGKMLPKKWNPKSKVDKIAHSEKNNTTQECTLNVFYINEDESTTIPIWRMTPCASDFSVVKSIPQMIAPPIKIEWWPPRMPRHTDHLRLIVTAVNSGETCLAKDQVTCLRVGSEPFMCVSDALACDGVRHCPVGVDGDEAASLCNMKHSNWVMEVIKRLTATHGELLGIDMVTTHPKNHSSKDVVVIRKKDGPGRKGLSALDAALEPYGTWGYLMLGMLICATVLIIFGVWECFCHYSRTHQDQSMPPDCIAPAAVVCSSQPQHWRPYPPPQYDELEPPPPSYNVLFPVPDKEVDTASNSTEPLASEPTTETAVAT